MLGLQPEPDVALAVVAAQIPPSAHGQVAAENSLELQLCLSWLDCCRTYAAACTAVPQPVGACMIRVCHCLCETTGKDHADFGR